MASESKRRRIDQQAGHCTSSSVLGRIDGVAKSGNNLALPVVQMLGISGRIQQARNSAVAQAQQDGCKGNFRIFDSPYGNFLVPVIPTRAELTG